MSSEEEKLNKKWKIHSTVQEAIKSSHSQPAPETRERLTRLETNQDNIMEKLIEFQEINKEQHQDIVKSLNEFHAINKQSFIELNTKLDEALKGKADIWVQKLLIGIGIAIGMGLLSYLGLLIVKLINI